MKDRVKTNLAWVISVALTGLDFLVAVLTSEMSYMTNDDAGIQNVLSGMTTGEPYPFHQFINLLLGLPISGLYRLFPNVQWWYVWSIIVVAVGIFLIHYCLLKTAVKNKVFLPIAIGILVFLDIGFFIYPIGNISFTIVPGILGTGIVAGLFFLADADTVKHERLLYVATIVGYVLLFCHRRQTGLVMLCFILLAYLYYFIIRSENWKKAAIKFIIMAAIFLAVTESLTVINRTVQNNINGEEFVAFNSARSQYMDYSHDSYEENPELYAEVGWDRDTYYLVSDWCFINENVTTEAFSYLSENSPYTSTDKIALLKTIYHNERCMELLLLYAASGIIALFLILVRFRKKTFLFLLLNNLGAIGLFAYQIMSGRAIYRSLIIIFLPAVVINLILSFRKDIDTKPVRYTFHIITLALGVLCVLPMLRATFDQDHVASMAFKKATQNTVDDYLFEHPENLYITQVGVTDNIDPRRLVPGPANSIGWGGSVYYSNVYYKQLEANGFSELSGATFKEDNVYLVSATNVMSDTYTGGDSEYGTDPFAMYLRYLGNHYGALGFVPVDELTDNAFVYHFVFEENTKDYDIYYDIAEDGTIVEVK